MAEDLALLQAQIQEAKRRKYANNEIVSKLVEQGDPHIKEALNRGYTPDQVISTILNMKTASPADTTPSEPSQKITQEEAAQAPPNVNGSFSRLLGYLSTPTKLAGDLYSGKYNVEDLLADIVPAAKTGASAATGAALTIGTGGLGAPEAIAGLAGSGGMSTVDTMLGKYIGEKPESILPQMGGEPSTAEQILEGTVMNELGGRVLSGAFRGGRAIFRGIDEALGGATKAAIPRTFSQYAKPGTRRFSQFLEDTLASGQKAAMLEKSEAAALDSAQQLVDDIGKRKVKLGDSNEAITQEAQNRLIENFDKSVEASGQAGEATKLIAETNPHTVTVKPAQQIPLTNSQGKPILDPFNRPVMTTIPAQTEEISGPIYLEETIQHAKRYVDQYEKAAVKDPESPTYQAAQSVLGETKAKFDTNGNLTDYEPISFNQAWNWKQEFGNYAYGSPKYDVSKVDARFKPLFMSLDRDIESSMATEWQNNGPDALNLYQRAKRLVNTRHMLFNPGGRAGRNTEVLLSNLDQKDEMIDPVIQQINQTLDSPTLLKRALKAGNLKVVLNKQAPTIKTMTGFKKDLRAYQLKRLFDNARDLKTGTFDTQKLFNFWLDTEKQESNKILFSNAERARVHQFLKDLTFFEQKPNFAYGTGLALRTVYGGLGLTGGIGTALLSGGSIPTSILVGGGIPVVVNLTGRMVAHALTNETSARVLQAMVSGKPLGMSHKAAARILAYAWRSEPVQAFINGQNVNGTFDAEGKFKEAPSEQEQAQQ